MKKYFAVDWYENYLYPEFLGDFDTEEEAEEVCYQREDDTDGECDCIIYPTDDPRYSKILAMATKA